MRTQKLTLAAVALAAGLSLTACAGGPQSASGSVDGPSEQTSSDVSQQSTGGSGGGPSAEDTSGSDVTTMAGTPTCRTSQLGMSISGGMAEGDHIVNLKNTGSSTCALKGFPGVDLKGEDGTISAARTDSKPSLVKVGAGKETRFTLHTPRNDSGGSGVTFHSIVVTPPNETHSSTMSLEVNLPVTDGADEQVRVEPVGWGK